MATPSHLYTGMGTIIGNARSSCQWLAQEDQLFSVTVGLVLATVSRHTVRAWLKAPNAFLLQLSSLAEPCGQCHSVPGQ